MTRTKKKKKIEYNNKITPSPQQKKDPDKQPPNPFECEAVTSQAIPASPRAVLARGTSPGIVESCAAADPLQHSPARQTQTCIYGTQSVCVLDFGVFQAFSFQAEV